MRESWLELQRSIDGVDWFRVPDSPKWKYDQLSEAIIEIKKRKSYGYAGHYRVVELIATVVYTEVNRPETWTTAMTTGRRKP